MLETFRAIQPRHGEIEDDEIGLEVWHGVQRLNSGGALTNRVADFKQDVRQDDPDRACIGLAPSRLRAVGVVRHGVRTLIGVSTP